MSERTKERIIEMEQLKAVLSTEAGRAFVWRMMEKAGIYRTAFSTDALAMAANEGRKDMGVWLFVEALEAAPGFVRTMEDEHRQELTDD